MAEVQRIKGIGPFYAGLIVVRAIGFVDVLPGNEPKALELVRELYHLPALPSQVQFEAIAEAWRPAHLGNGAATRGRATGPGTFRIIRGWSLPTRGRGPNKRTVARWPLVRRRTTNEKSDHPTKSPR